LRSQIREIFPNDTIIGEEEAEYQGSSERRWIIDPLDGTFSFVHGVPLYGVLIGLEIRSETILGVVNMPAIDELVYAAQGCGCFWNGQRTSTSQTDQLSDALLLSTDFGISPNYGLEEGLKQLQRTVAARRTWGDCYGHVLVATGRADIMLDPVMKIWDCAALLPIIEEAGGTFTDWYGERTIYAGNALSSNGLLFEQVRKVINRVDLI
jgi:histidinol-phosphatase